MALAVTQNRTCCARSLAEAVHAWQGLTEGGQAGGRSLTRAPTTSEASPLSRRTTSTLRNRGRTCTPWLPPLLRLEKPLSPGTVRNQGSFLAHAA